MNDTHLMRQTSASSRLVAEPPIELARALDAEAQHLSANLPLALCGRALPTRDASMPPATEAEWPAPA